MVAQYFREISTTRSHRVAISALVVILAYGIYAQTIARLIEPPPRRGSVTKIDDPLWIEAINRPSEQLPNAEGLFPKGAWQLKNTMKLEVNERMLLLWRYYKDLGDGRVHLMPFTAIMQPDDPTLGPEARKRQCLVLEATGGAVIRMSKSLDFSGGDIGEFQYGRLLGNVTIRSSGRDPGPLDDLLITTSEVRLSPRDITTNSPVAFRFGPNHGHGSGLRIDLADDEDAIAGAGISTRIQQFRLAKVERIRLHPARSRLTGQPGQATDPLDNPIEITCQGPFVFNVPNRKATFSDRVDVVRINPVGPSDQMNCQTLAIYFKSFDPVLDKTDDRTDDAAAGRSEDFVFQPERVVATGGPVIVNAPSRGGWARGRELVYEVDERRLSLMGGGAQTQLRHGPSEVFAKTIRYTFNESGNGRLGVVLAEGPGRILAQTGEANQERISATWNEMLSIQPDEGMQRVFLTGGASLTAEGIGELNARQISFWADEQPAAEPGGDVRLVPNAMVAEHDVKIAAEQLDAAVDKVEIRFKQQRRDTSVGGLLVASRNQVAASGASRTGNGPTLPASADASVGPPVSAAPLPSPQPERSTGSALANLRENGESRQHFQVTAQVLKGRVLMPEEDQGQAELTELTLYHDVRVVETVTELPGEKPITITGDQVAIQGVTRPDSRITLLGAPARFEARGVRVDGTNINVDRGDSRIWITGPGTLDVVVQRDLQGRPLAAPGVLRTTWQEGMLLHGSLIRFDEEVTASMSGGRLDTKTLELTLTSPIDLSPGATGGIGAGGGTGGGPEIERLFCRGGVMLENAAHQAGRPTSYDRLRASDLTMNVKTGRMTAAGPGRLSSVRVGSGSMMLAGQGGSSDGAVSSQAADNMTLQALTVEFEGPIGGNMNQRQLTFQRRVRTAFAPVDAWDVVLPTDAPELLGPRGALISCDMLTVAQVYTPLTGEESLELEAVGNTVVEGDLFTARAARMTYAQAKDLLMLEGSGRTDAVLYRRTAIGAAPSQAAARRIYFWPQSRRWKIDDARTLEITGGSLQRR